MTTDTGERSAPRLAARPEFAVLKGDLAHLVGQVQTQSMRLPRSPSLFQTDDFSLPAVLPTDWAFALVSLASWIGRGLGVSDQVRLRSLVGGYYYFTYILAIDALLDRRDRPQRQRTHRGRGRSGASGASRRQPDVPASLALLHLLAIRQYQPLFPPDSSFWAHLERYHGIWMEALVWERAPAPYRALPLRDAMVRESGKCAGLYITCAAVALGGRQEHLLPYLERAAMATNMAMNLVDDCDDWWDDLAAGRHNSFIALAAAHDLIPASPSHEDMVTAVLSGSLHDLYAVEVARLAEEARQLAEPLGITLWLPFLDMLSEAARQYPAGYRAQMAELSSRLFGAGSGSPPARAAGNSREAQPA